MRALITGINGQDGSYLAELLLDKGYQVHGTIRRASTDNLARIAHIKQDLTLYYADLSDGSALSRVVQVAAPNEVYNLAANSDVRVSFDTPVYTSDVTGIGCTRLLEVVRQHNPEARFYQAGSSEMFGMNPDVPTNEQSLFCPGSPYAAAKVYAHYVTQVYRESYNMFASNGILFNHESERRGIEFVTRKITLGLADIVHGRASSLTLGNLDAKRDWGHARDYVRAMHLMLQANKPGDFVIATGQTHSVREFLDIAAERAGLVWQDYVTTDPYYFRPMDPPVLLGDATKARDELGWEPTVTFHQLARDMMDADL